MKSNPTSEEKLWAVIAHISVILSGTGLLMPAFAWMEQRTKSKYLAFQTLQAFAYQSLGYTLWALVALFVLTILSFATFPLLKQGEGLNLWLASHALVTFGLYVVYLALPLIGVVASIAGRDFRYPILGRRLAGYIGYDPAADDDASLDEANEERVAASMAHFAVVYPLWGMFPALLFLLLPGEKSRYMKFHALQTIVFQAISTLVTFALGGLAFVVLLGSMLPVVIALQSGKPLVTPPIESMLGFFVFLLCLMVFLLIAPLYQIVGQWAGLMLLLGREYRYPLIGRWAERWLEKREVASAEKKL